MRLLISLVFIYLCAACGGSMDSDNNHGYGWHYDAMVESGLRLRYEPGVPAMLTADLRPPAEMIVWFEEVYVDVEKCSGLQAHSRPLVIVVTNGSLFPNSGRALTDTRTVLVDDFSQFRGFIWNLRHEYIHDLLKATGFPDDRNSSHDSPLFDACGPV